MTKINTLAAAPVPVEPVAVPYAVKMAPSTIRQATEALRYLSTHDRPIGGEQSFNWVHLNQIADDLEPIRAMLAASPAPTTPAEVEPDHPGEEGLWRFWNDKARDRQTALTEAKAEIERLKQINANLMGDDEDQPRYTTKRLRQEVARKLTECIQICNDEIETAKKFGPHHIPVIAGIRDKIKGRGGA